MGGKGVSASFIQYCKKRKLSAHKVAVIMKKRGFSEDQVLEVYKKLYSGERIRKSRPKRALQKAARHAVDHRSAETKRMLMMIQNNQYYLTLFAFMLMGFMFSTLYILTAFMPDIFGVFIIFGVGYLNGILLYNVFRMFKVSFIRHIIAPIFAPFMGLCFIAAGGFFFAAIRDFVLEQYSIHGVAVVETGMVVTVISPLDPIIAMLLFYFGYNIHTLTKFANHKPHKDFTAYFLGIPIFLFALFVGWGIFHFFMKDIIISNIFG